VAQTELSARERREAELTGREAELTGREAELTGREAELTGREVRALHEVRTGESRLLRGEDGRVQLASVVEAPEVRFAYCEISGIGGIGGGIVGR
jgi:hypothetical protein